MKKLGISYRFLYIIAVISVLSLSTSRIMAQTVDIQELMTAPPVEFINFEGPPIRIDTREQIRDIGYSLGQAVRAGVSQPGALNRYFVIHSVSPPDGNRLDADIFGIGVDAAVDHIRNVRLIIQGYLEAAYGYSESDAALLAEFITVYNAVYRGDWDFFVSRYKDPVLGHLVSERAGISIRYDEWPGQTLMVIPLGTGLGGQLSAIDTGEITDQRVIDHFRQEPDMGLEQRRDMVYLMEREADAAAQEAAIAREAIQEEEERIAQEMLAAQQQQQEAQQQQQQIAEARQDPDADQLALDQQQQVAQQQEQAAQQRQEELAQQQEALEEQRELAERQEAFAEQRVEAAQEQRQMIAEDQQQLIDQAPPPPLFAGGVLGVSILSYGSSPLGRIVRLDANTGREVLRSPLTSVNVRTITMVGNRLLAIAGEDRNNASAAIRLVEIDANSLDMIRQGNNDIAPGSLLWLNGQNVYAITNAGGNSYLARFNADLVLQSRSSIPVHPFATVLFYGTNILTQREDGSAAMLNATDMSERR